MTFPQFMRYFVGNFFIATEISSVAAVAPISAKAAPAPAEVAAGPVVVAAGTAR